MARRATAPPKKASPKKAPRRFRTHDEIELMAQDMMENPGDTLTAVAKRWDSGQSYMTDIRNGTHSKMSERTKLMVAIMCGRVSPLNAKAKSILKEYYEDPDSIPEGVRRRFEASVPKHQKVEEPPKLETPATPEPEPKPLAPEVEVQQQPEPLPMPQHHRKPEQMSLIRAEGVVFSYAPVQVGEAPVQVGAGSASLKDILEAARKVMRTMGITKVILPEFGDIVIERKEILQ